MDDNIRDANALAPIQRLRSKRRLKHYESQDSRLYYEYVKFHARNNILRMGVTLKYKIWNI